MKLFAFLLPIGLVSALVTKRDETSQLADQVASTNQLVSAMVEGFAQNAQCCDATPCFIGCPVGGVPRVSIQNLSDLAEC